MPSITQPNVFNQEFEGVYLKPTLKSSQRYKENISAPRTALEWQLALANPLSEIGRDYYNLVISEHLDQVDIRKLQQKLALTHFIRQERLNEHLRREIEYRASVERHKLLQARMNAQIKLIPKSSSKGWLEELLYLLKNTISLSILITMQQSEVDKQWNHLHQLRAQNIVAKLRAQNIVLPFELTEAKQQQLSQALTPLSPSLLLKLHPGLAKRARKLEENEVELDSFCHRLSKTNDAMCELAFHSMLTNNQEPLMGANLLAAIKHYRQPFQQAGITFDTLDPALHLMMKEQIDLFNQKENTQRAIESTEQQMKAAYRAFNQPNIELANNSKKSRSR